MPQRAEQAITDGSIFASLKRILFDGENTLAAYLKEKICICIHGNTVTFCWQAVSECKRSILGIQAFIGNNRLNRLIFHLTKDLINKNFLKSDIAGLLQFKWNHKTYRAFPFSQQMIIWSHTTEKAPEIFARIPPFLCGCNDGIAFRCFSCCISTLH